MHNFARLPSPAFLFFSMAVGSLLEQGERMPINPNPIGQRAPAPKAEEPAPVVTSPRPAAVHAEIDAAEIEVDTLLRERMLSLLYAKRRRSMQSPGIGAAEFERLLRQPAQVV